MSSFSIRFKIVAVVVAALLVALGAVALLLDAGFRENQRSMAERAVRVAESAFANLEANDTAMLSATLEALLENRELRQAFAERDRERLFALAEPLHQRLRDRYRITHMYFITPEPEAQVFLRVHKKEQAGDKVERSTLRAAVASRAFGAGKEIGQTAFALRVVHPILEGSQVVGYLELGEEIGHFLDLMRKETGDDFAMLVEKEHLRREEWEAVQRAQGLPNRWDSLKDLVVVGSAGAPDVADLEGKLGTFSGGARVLSEERVGGRSFVRGLFPLFDAEKREVGAVLVRHDVTEAFLQQQATERRILLIVALLMVALASLMVWGMNVLVVRRLRRMIDVATVVVGGDYDRQIVKSADDEIGEFETLFEQFRVLFVSLLPDDKRRAG